MRVSENSEPAEAGPPDPSDPFAGLVLDDDFVNSARAREAAAADRVRRTGRIAREHHRLESEREILGASPTGGSRPNRRRRRMAMVLLAVLVIALLTWIVLADHTSSGTGGAGALLLHLR